MRTGLVMCLGLIACAATDSAGYVLPSGSLSDVSAMVYVKTRAELQSMAAQIGIFAPVNALSSKKYGKCYVYLADDKAGLGALEHELWHCRLGAWHD